MKKAYIALPYTSELETIRILRFEAANRFAAKLMDEGYRVFSPISHSHLISKHVKSKQDNAFWMKQDLWILEMCDVMFVLCLPGWMESKGIADELAMALEKNINVVLVNEWEV